MAKGTLRVNGVLVASEIHKIVQESGTGSGGGTGVGDEILLETGFHILTEVSATAALQAQTGDNIVIREDDGTAVLTVDTSGVATFTGNVNVGTDDVGHDVKFYGDTASKYWMWDQSADQMKIVGSSDQTGNAQLTGTLTVGVDGTGHDVKFFGDTASRYMLWDQSADMLFVSDNAKIGFGAAGADMQLYHNGSHSYIDNAVGGLNIATLTSGIAVTIGHSTSVVTIGDNLTVTDTLTESSMREMKDNIEPIENILPAVMQLQGVTFDWKKDKDNDKRSNHYGLIAEDVEKILPNLVSHDASGKAQGIQYSKMTAVLLEAIKEQQIQIDELKSKLN